jgi:tetratricopeptide (TPR) repeat protein
MDDLASIAVAYALNNDWNNAIQINKDILKLNPEDVDALNRLSRAYFESGDTKNALKTSQKALGFDPTNTIALKSVEKYKKAKVNLLKSSKSASPSDLIEEPGKTKIVSLLNLGQTKIISCLDSGDEVTLQTHSHRVCITTQDGKYIGRLPDDISARLRNFVKGGNKYKILIKSVDIKTVKVFIKEVFKSPKFKDVNSFLIEKSESLVKNSTYSD